MSYYRVVEPKTEKLIKKFKTLDEAIHFRKEYGESKCKIVFWMY